VSQHGISSTHRRLKRSRIPCEQYLDMGKSVLTASREGISGKGRTDSECCDAFYGVLWSLSHRATTREREFGERSETGLWGRGGFEARFDRRWADAGQSHGCGEFSFLFDGLIDHITHVISHAPDESHFRWRPARMDSIGLLYMRSSSIVWMTVRVHGKAARH